ncbi:uncharacterized protein LOC62_04G006068 [Vanrija pseudolonga]|uniref:Uncharacterized protein n=1 Tax=Vanrija pseudolonga TaxID=143232 RepID=A0AAF1BIR5_9TREE|nr:hypothetical protein LOC62_04G006068 [Vanrija pseudolonga]
MSLHVHGHEAPYRHHWTVGPGPLYANQFRFLAYRRLDGASWFAAEVDELASYEDGAGQWVWGFVTVRGEAEERGDEDVVAVAWDEWRRLKGGEEGVYWPAYDRRLAQLQRETHAYDYITTYELKAAAHAYAHEAVADAAAGRQGAGPWWLNISDDEDD